MANLNITNIPAPRVPFIDERTGLMAREWYRFFLNLFVLTGSGNNPVSLEELQLGPPNPQDLTELLIQINQNIAPQYEDQSGDFLKTLDTAQLMSMMSQFANAEAAIQGAYLQPVVQTGTIANYNLDGSPTAGGVAYGTGPALAVSVAGTLGQVLTSGGAGAPTWASIPHTIQVFTSGSGIYTTPANCKAIWVRCVGGGGGGGSGNAGSPTNGTGGGNTTFSTLTATGGSGGPNSLTGGFTGGAGGTPTGGDINIRGGGGQNSIGNTSPAVFQGYGMNGGNSAFGGGGRGGTNGAGATGGAAESGGGGGGVGGNLATYASVGGGAGGYCEKLINSPNSTYSYAVGAGGAGGAAGTGGGTGGAGGAGLIIVTEFYV